MSLELYIPNSRREELLYNQLFSGDQFGFGFVGIPYQRGAGIGSIFSGLFKAISPLAKSAAKSIGKATARTALGVASDVLQGQDPVQSLQTRGIEEATQLLHKADRRINKPKRRRQRGRGLGLLPLGTTRKTIKGLRKGRKKGKVDIFA